MNIHEHQAKAVLREYGVPLLRGAPAFSADEAAKAAADMGGSVFVVKSQIHAGGRGKGRFEGLGPDAKGGVRVVKSVDEVRSNAEEMLGRTLVTIQTGPTCGWTAVPSVTWITLNANSSGTGPATLTYSFDRNFSRQSRSGTISIAGETHRVIQRGR